MFLRRVYRISRSSSSEIRKSKCNLFFIYIYFCVQNIIKMLSTSFLFSSLNRSDCSTLSHSSPPIVTTFNWLFTIPLNPKLPIICAWKWWGNWVWEIDEERKLYRQWNFHILGREERQTPDFLLFKCVFVDFMKLLELKSNTSSLYHHYHFIP